MKQRNDDHGRKRQPGKVAGKERRMWQDRREINNQMESEREVICRGTNVIFASDPIRKKNPVQKFHPPA